MDNRLFLGSVCSLLVASVLMVTQAAAGVLLLKKEDWTLVSPPRDLQGITLRALTRNYLDAAEFGSGWSVFKYLDTGVYQSASLDEPLEQGRGYWMITMGADIEIPLPANSHVTPDHALASCDGPCFGMALSSAEDSVSWNLLGYTYEFGQSFGQARVVSESGACASGCSPVQAEAAGQMSETIYHYDGAAYQLLDSNSMVQPWQGFWAASPAQSGGNPAELIFDNPIQSPLIGYWPLDDGSGLSAHDASGEDNPVTLTQAFWGPGRQQSGVCLSGTLDDEITSPGVANPQSLSIAAWIKPDADIEKWGWIGGFGDSAGLYIRRDGGLVMYIWDGATWPDLKVTQSQLQDKLELGAEGLYDGQWHHVVGSYDPVSGFSIHVDGVLIDSASAATGFNYGQGGQWHIGSMQGERNFSGCLDEVMVYGSVLSTAEIKALSDQESESTEPALNVAPQVSVGADQTIVLPQSASVSLSVTDDGRPAGGQLTAQWLQRSGPSVALPAVTFNSAGSGVSVFNFSQAGVYEFELIANDSDKQGSDTTRITVESGVDPVAGAICISEFQAADQDVIADEDGNYPDWIELHNPGGEAVSLANWCLTDDAGEPDQWCFESGTIAGNGYVVVFASKENRQTPNHHTNFKLGKGGDYLGLYNPSGEEACAFEPEYPEQFDNISYGLDASGSGVYFGNPTPGSANDLTSIGTPIQIEKIDDLVMDVGEVRNIDVVVSGGDLSALTFDDSDLAGIATLTNNQDGTARIRLSPGFSGTFDITVRAVAGLFTDKESFTVTAVSSLASLDSADQLELTWDGKPLLLDAANDRLFLSLGEQYLTARSHSGVFNYRHSTSGYAVSVDGNPVTAGSSFAAFVKHGDLLNLLVTRNGVTVWNLDVVITHLPILQIFADEIVDEPKLPGMARWVDGDRDIDSGLINLGIEFRGVSAQLFEKKPFGLEFRETDSDAGQNIELLGLRNDDDWIADAAFRDQTFARNIVTHDLYREMRAFAYIDEEGTEQGQSTVAGGLAELILNSSYHGVYMMHERVDRKLLALEQITVPEDESGERWDLVDFDDPANGSVLYKAQRNRADLTADSASEFEQTYPDSDDIDYFDALDELISYVNDTSDEVFAATVGDVVNLDSLIDYWLITLATANRDALWKNYYLARNRDGQWFFVPWDYDATYGMTYLGGEDDSSDRAFQFDKSRLLVRIGENPSIGFYQKARTRWLTLRDSVLSVDAIAARFAGYAEQLDRAAGSAGKSPRERNLDRWPDTGNDGAGQPELGQVSYLRAWLVRRMEYVDAKLRDLAGE